MSITYAILFAISVVMLVGYSVFVRKKEFWLLLLFVCVAIVNMGYFMLSSSKTLEFALLSNKIAYLGSVFLSMCMFMSIVNLCGFKYHKALPSILLGVGVLMFGIVCTTGYLPWYYKEVSIVFVDGAAKLKKVYGPLHPTYLIYLMLYFASMVAVIFTSIKKKFIALQKQAVLIATVVFGNMAVWFVEKFIPWDFEFLAVSYLFGEAILLGVYWMMQDYVHANQINCVSDENGQPTSMELDLSEMTIDQKVCKALSVLRNGEKLSSREMEILGLILENKKRKEIAEDLHLSENTIKTHTRTLYSKLGVGSREELYALLDN